MGVLDIQNISEKKETGDYRNDDDGSVFVTSIVPLTIRLVVNASNEVIWKNPTHHPNVFAG